MDIKLTTWLELSQLRVIDALPKSFEKAKIYSEEATPIHDLNGEVLFMRTPVNKGRTLRGYADIAVHPAFGEPLLSVSSGAAWNEQAIVRTGMRQAREMGMEREPTEIRFVAYSYPKIALQFFAQDEELLMLEIYSWQVVPSSKRNRLYEPPSDFERWSFLEEMPEDRRARREDRFKRRVNTWQEALGRSRFDRNVLDSEILIDRAKIDRAKIDRFALYATRELHYSSRNTDHFTCYELRGQETNVWCVGASVQMVLDFYRYEYTQTRLATELGLGTSTNPNGLPYSNDYLVVDVLEKMSCNALNASMNTNPNFSEYASEINANRPLISFIPGHSRTVVGYTQSLFSILGQAPFRGLLVYDPWPPNTGVITRWENYNTSTYRRTFTARLNKA